MHAFFSNCENVVVRNGTFITNYQTYPAAEEGGEVTAEQQASNARQQPHEARQQAHEARQQALITNYQTRPAAQEGGEVTAQQQVSKARQQAHEARQQARRRARRVRQQEHEARQRTWTAWLFGASDRDSTDSEEGDSDVDFQQHVSLNGVRVEQRSGPMGRECDVRIFSQAEEGQRRDQEGTQRKIEQMGASLEKAAKLMERKGSEMSAALENAANKHAEHTREQHGSNTTKFNHSQGRQHSGFSVSYVKNGTVINLGRTTTTGPQSSRPPKAKQRSHSIPNPLYTERHKSAASVIQRKFRIHRSFRSIDIISLEFQMVKDAFVYPRVIDIQVPGSEEGYISLRVNRVPSEFDEGEGGASMEVDESQPKLAYTLVNFPIHSHREQLEQLLVRLDGIESWDDKGVREKRCLLVKEVEKESEKLERCWKQAWIDYLEKKQRKGKQDKEARAGRVDRGLIYAEPQDDEWFDVSEA